MSQETESSKILQKLDDTSEKHLEKARTIYNEFVQGRMRAGNLPGEPDRSLRGQAYKLVMKVLEKYPDDPRPLFILGTIFHGMGEFPKAEYYLKKASDTGASSLELHRLLADLYLERREYGEAEKHTEFIRQNDPTRPEIYELKSEIALRKEDWESRLEALTRLLEINPSDERLGVAIATTLVKMGKGKTALEKLLQFNENIPNSSEINFLLGNLLSDSGKSSLAKTYYSKALEFNPDHNMARFELANVLDELDHPREALELYREYIAVIKHDPDAYYNAAGVAERLEDRPLAVKYYLEFLKLTDDDDDFAEVLKWLNQNAPGYIEPSIFQIELAMAHLERDDPEPALKELRIASDIGVVDRRTLFLQGRAYFSLGNFETAVNNFKKAMEFDDPCDIDGFTDDDVLLAIGETSLELGDLKDVVETAGELISVGVLAEDGHTLLGDMFLEKEEYTKAKEEFMKALKINLFSFDGMFGLGETFEAIGDFDTASTCFRLCLEIEPDDVESLYRIGMDYLRLGYKEWAKHYLRQFKEKSDDGDYAFEVPEIP